ncbi:MAG: acyl-CoA dehydrogenase family protein [Ilumatobacteraceae bacterium]
MDFELDDDAAALAMMCRDFARNEIAPIAAQAWEAERCPIEVLAEMGKLGLLGLLVPEKWGGSDATTVAFVAAIEEIGRVDQSIAAAVQAHNTIGSLPLLRFGTDTQRERWLRPLAEGTALGAFGLTEPDAGSDARGIKTKAVRGDGGWLINGQKTFISNAGTDMTLGVTLLARTGEDSSGRPQYGTFVVEKGTTGFTIGSKMRGIGWKSLDTRPLMFDDVWVTDEHLIGDPSMGLGQFLGTLEVGRIAVAALSMSLTSAVLEMAKEYALQRKQFGKRISDFQAIQFKLADMATELEASRLLTYRAAALRDAGKSFTKEAAMAKLYASRAAAKAASEAVQIFGGVGYMLETPIARFYCDSKVLEIGEGTNEIQHMVIARLLGC